MKSPTVSATTAMATLHLARLAILVVMVGVMMPVVKTLVLASRVVPA